MLASYLRVCVRPWAILLKAMRDLGSTNRKKCMTANTVCVFHFFRGAEKNMQKNPPTLSKIFGKFDFCLVLFPIEQGPGSPMTVTTTDCDDTDIQEQCSCLLFCCPRLVLVIFDITPPAAADQAMNQS